jgi:hypothetical protein
VEVTGSGVSWQNTTAAKSEDGIGAVATLDNASNDESLELVTRDFGLNVPTNARIEGVTVVIRKRASAPGTTDMRDESVRLVINGNQTGSNKADDEWSTAFANVTYGSEQERWTTELTPAKVNSPAFGLALRAKNHGSINTVAEVDTVTVRVTYCE